MSLKAKWEGEDVNSGIGFSEDEEDETVAESLVFDQAGAPSGKPHDKDVRQQEQVSQNKIARSKAQSKDEPVPIEASLQRGLHWIRNAFLAR